MLVGADPGKFGAYALYSWKLQSVYTYAVPLYLHQRVAKKPIHRVNCIELLALANALGATEPVGSVFEDVGGMPTDGGSRAFQFGCSAGRMEMALLAAGIPALARVAPSVWKAVLGVPAYKAAAIARANELMPYGAKSWGSHDGKAEAALIAYYGAHVLGLDGCPVPAKPTRRKFTAASIAAAMSG